MYSFRCFSACAAYAGDQHTTIHGLTCQRWDVQSPHKHGNTDPAFFPDISLSHAENYCRNPDGAKYTWCYTDHAHARWQYCEVPGCSPYYY